MNLLALIADFSPIALLIGIAVLIVFILALLALLLWRKVKAQKAESGEAAQEAPPQENSQEQEKPTVKANPEEIQPSVTLAVKFLNQNSSGRGSGYGTPWFLALGAAGSGKSTLLDNSGISLSLRGGAADFGIEQGIKWRFFDAGVILDVPGDLFVQAEKNASDERSWKELLRNLYRQRPQRAMDGIVLTIPCTELVGDTALSPALIGQRATYIFDKLWQIQKWLGFCYPVYVVITKCDLIPGFKSLARQLPAHCQREMFGWSNPYNLDAAFDSSWVDQAFDELARNVHRLQSEVFVERQHIADVDDLFLFSARLQELKKPLRIYLAQLMKKSAYRESLQFRGFYFTGDATEIMEEKSEPVRAIAAAASSYSGFVDTYPEITGDVLSLTPVLKPVEQHAPIFVTDLFEAKIFPERALARPVTRVRLSKSRMVMATQAACLVASIVLSLGLFLSYRRLAHAQNEGLEHLKLISKRLKDRVPAKHPVNDVETTLAPLNTMEDLTGHHHFKSFFIPSSFLLSVDDGVTAAMGPAFKEIMYKGIRQELVARGQALFDDQVVAASNNGNVPRSAISIKDVPSYQKLHEFTDGLLYLEENVARYNKVVEPGGGDAESLLALAKYVAGAQFQKEFDATLKQHDSYLSEIVLKSRGEPLNPAQIITPQQAQEKMQEYVHAVFTEWLPPDGRIQYLDDLAKKLNAFGQQDLHTFAQLNDLRSSLAEAQQVLSSPEFSWMNQGKVDVIAPLQETMDQVTLRPVDQQLFLCNSSAAQENFCPQLEGLKRFIRQTEEQDLQNFRTALLSKETKVTGQLLDSQSEVLQLSPAANTVLSLLNTMLKLPFVEREGSGTIHSDLDKSQQLLWQKDELQTAIQYKDAFENFLKGEFESAPSNVQDAFESAALTMLEQNMVDMVEHAENLQPLSSVAADQSIAPEVQSLQEAIAPLNTILASFQELGFDDAQRSLLALTTKQASHLLLRIDDAFEAQRPYARNVSFERWDSDNTPSKAGFDIHNPDEMAQYLAYQRQQVQQYAALAAPVVNFLEPRVPAGGKEPGRTLLKWQQIIAELQKIQAKVPGTSVAALEDFIGTQIDKATPENCQTGFLTTAASQGGDYFVQTRETIRHSLYTQCRALSEQNAVRSYGQIAKFFNQHLAGKFPFSVAPQEQMPAEADPQDVAEMFRMLNTSGKSIHAGLQNGNFGNSYSRVLAFLNQLEGLQPLFAPMTTAEDQVPVFDFVPVFRVNQGREVNGNQIIDWTLQVGTDTFHFHDPQRAGRWNYGDPVKLTLRWAKDSPQQPVSSASAVDSKLSSRSVVFEYRDSWALFTMLALHQPVPNDFDRMVDPEPQTLVFLVNDSKSSDPAAKNSGTNAPPQAKVFVRLKLRPAGKPDNLRVRVFPTEAPSLKQNNTQASNDGNTGGDQQ